MLGIEQVAVNVLVTVTVKLHCDELPQASVAIAVTVVTPELNIALSSVARLLLVVAPLKLYITVALLQLSLAVAFHAVPACLYVHDGVPLLGVTDLSEVHEMDGAALSTTVIVLDTDATALPHASVAVHVSVTVPHPLTGAAVNVDAFDVPLIKQSPLNPLLNGKVLADGIAPQATVISPGAVIVGNAAGLTVIVLDTD